MKYDCCERKACGDVATLSYLSRTSLVNEA